MTKTDVIKMTKKNGAATLVFNENYVISNHYDDRDMLVSQAFLNVNDLSFDNLIEINEYISKLLTERVKKILETIE